jgi:hypothetical protein
MERGDGLNPGKDLQGGAIQAEQGAILQSCDIGGTRPVVDQSHLPKKPTGSQTGKFDFLAVGAMTDRDFAFEQDIHASFAVSLPDNGFARAHAYLLGQFSENSHLAGFETAVALKFLQTGPLEGGEGRG